MLPRAPIRYYPLASAGPPKYDPEPLKHSDFESLANALLNVDGNKPQNAGLTGKKYKHCRGKITLH